MGSEGCQRSLFLNVLVHEMRTLETPPVFPTRGARHPLVVPEITVGHSDVALNMTESHRDALPFSGRFPH